MTWVICSNRVVTLASKQDVFEVTSPQNWGARELELRDSFWNMLDLFESDMEDAYYYRALNSLWKYINEVNAYFHAQEPWKITDKARFQEVISATCHSLHAIGILLHPVMPRKMDTMLASLGVSTEFKGDIITDLGDNPWNKTYMLTKIPTLFHKYEAEEAKPEAISQQAQKPAFPEITIDEFAKVALIVGTIEQCEEVSGSDKLLKLQVDFGGYGKRQILSGVKKSFSPSDLVGKQAVFVFNLAPRKMMGLESQGMLLTAEDAQNKLSIVTPAGQVPNGARLK